METPSAEPEWLIQAIMDVKELPSWQNTSVLLIEQTLLILREKGVNLFSDMSEEEAGEHIDRVEKLLQSSEGPLNHAIEAESGCLPLAGNWRGRRQV